MLPYENVPLTWEFFEWHSSSNLYRIFKLLKQTGVLKWNETVITVEISKDRIDENAIQDTEADRQSDSSHSQNEHDKEELRVAMLKCITKSKYDDVDDYLQWLNDCTTVNSHFLFTSCIANFLPYFFDLDIQHYKFPTFFE